MNPYMNVIILLFVILVCLSVCACYQWWVKLQQVEELQNTMKGFQSRVEKYPDGRIKAIYTRSSPNEEWNLRMIIDEDGRVGIQ